MTRNISPASWRKIANLIGIRDLADSGQLAHCPFCRQGKIMFYTDAHHGRWWCSPCCDLAGSLDELVTCVRKVPTDEVETWLREHLPEARLDLGRTDHGSGSTPGRAKLLDRIWEQAGTLSQLYVSQQFYQQMQFGGLDVDHPRPRTGVGIDLQLRAILQSRLEPLLAELLPDERRALRVRDGRDEIYFVMRGFRFPGRAVSLCLCRFTGKGKMEQHLLLEDPESRDAGLAIHPVTAVRNRDVVLTDDLAWYLTCSFWLDHSSQGPNPLVYCFDQASAGLHSLQMLGTRRKLVWTPVLSAPALAIAARHGCAVSHFGVDHGLLNRRAQRVLNARRLFDDLVPRAEPWPKRLRMLAEKQSLLEIETLIQAAGLSNAELSEVAHELPEALVGQLQSIDRSRCPTRQISCPEGIVEQSSAGWRLVNRRGTELLCSSAWRIVGTMLDIVPCYQLEVYQAGAWQPIRVPVSRLLANPLRGLASAAAEHQLQPIVGSARYRHQLPLYAELLNPGTAGPITAQTHRLGFEPTRGILRTSQLELQADPVRLRSVKLLSEQPGLWRLADQVLPASSSLSQLLDHPGCWLVVNGVAQQALRHLTGKPPLVISYGEQMRGIVLAVLDALELLAPGSSWPCDVSRCSAAIQDRLPRGTRESRQGIWLAASSRQAHWLAGLRPVLRLSDRHFEVPAISGRELQRTLVQVLHGALSGLERSSATDQDALESGWRSLLARTGNRHRTVPSIPAPLSPLDAVLYWTQQAIRAQHFSVVTRQLVRPTIKTVVDCRGQVTIPVSGLNRFLAEQQFSRWDTVDLVARLAHERLFVGTKTKQQRLYLQIKREALWGAAEPVGETGSAQQQSA